MLSNDSTYIPVGTDVSSNSSYTCPADGIYNLRVTGSSGNMGAWYIDSNRSISILCNANSNAITGLIALKSGTKIYTRGNYGSYRVIGYYAIN